MPPNLDVYALTSRRDRATLDRFLDAYADLERSKERFGGEIQVRKLGAKGEGEEAYEWLPAATIDAALQAGLARPSRCFTLYLAPRSGSESAVVSFTTDDRLVLGLSVDDEEQGSEGMARAEELLSELARGCGATLGLIAQEEPPPQSEAAFRGLGKSALRFKQFPG